MKSTSIQELVSAVVDTGRRGNPKPGCDCVQCFGYCQVDPDVAFRETSIAAAERARVQASIPLNLPNLFGEANASA